MIDFNLIRLLVALGVAIAKFREAHRRVRELDAAERRFKEAANQAQMRDYLDWTLYERCPGTAS